MKDLGEVTDELLSKLKDYTSEYGKDVLDYLREEIDLLKDKNNELDKIEEREKKILAINKQKQKIANIEKELNHKQLVNGVWTNVADATALREERETLADMELDLFEFDRERDREAELQNLENFYDAQSEMIERFGKLHMDTFENLLGDVGDELRLAINLYNQELSKIGDLTGLPDGGATGTQDYPDLTSYEQGILDDMAENSRLWHLATTDEDRDALHDENLRLSEELDRNVVYDPATGTWNVLEYHKGGFVGGNPLDKKHEVVAKFLKGELAIPPDQLDFASKFIPQALFPQTSQLAGMGGGGDIFIDRLEVHADNADDLVSQLKNLSRLTVKQ